MSGLKRVSNKLYNFASGLVGNRVLDLYLKYNGIKMLTTATLVPVALILGRDMFEHLIKQQQGGKLKIPEDLPVIDDPLIGNSLKLAGVTSLANVTPYTLVPIGGGGHGGGGRSMRGGRMRGRGASLGRGDLRAKRRALSGFLRARRRP